MNKEKQIEEMSTLIYENRPIKDIWNEEADCIAKTLYNAGYRKQSEGEWILTGTFKSTFPLPVADLHKACSVCKWIPPKYSADYKEYNFCPNCGAKMKGGVE